MSKKFRYRPTALYRVWTGENVAHESIYTRGTFNHATTGRFICYEQYADSVRPVEVRLKCVCGFDLGWVAVAALAEEPDGLLCDACGRLVTP